MDLRQTLLLIKLSLIFVVSGDLTAFVAVNDPNSNFVIMPINCSINVSSTTVEINIFNPDRLDIVQNAITNGNFADIVVHKITAIKTKDEIVADGGISVTFTITAKPNPAVVGGYSLFVKMLPMRLNTLLSSNNFFNFQAISLIGFINSMIFFNIVGTNQWFSEIENSMVISYSNISDKLIEVDDSFGSSETKSITLTFSIPSSLFTSLPNGVWWFSVASMMMPNYKKTIEQIVVETSNRLTLNINNLIYLINTQLTLTDTVIANKTFLKNRLIAIKGDYTLFFTNLANQPTTTDDEKTLIEATIHSLDLLLSGLIA